MSRNIKKDLVQGLAPIVIVHFDGGDGRVMVADSLSYFEHETWLNDVVLGVKAGQTGDVAARLMLKASAGHACDLTGVIDETIYEMLATPRGKLFAVWSFSRVEGEHPNDVLCVASHGGQSYGAIRAARETARADCQRCRRLPRQFGHGRIAAGR